MMRRSSLDRLNAYLVVMYYLLIMVFGVLIKHPLHLGVMLIAGIIMALIVAGARATLRTLGYSMILVALIMVINPLVSHEGVTRIMEIGDFYVTLESVAYGGVSAMMFVTVFMWFVSFNVIMTGDKYIYVLGRFLPSISLLISLTLRLIPELNKEYDEQKMSIKSMGMFRDEGFWDKAKLSAYALKGVIRRSIESSTTRAESMEARGYGIAHRSSYLSFRWRISDSVFALSMVVLSSLVIAGHVMHHSYANYYPIINVDFSGTYTIVSLVIMMAFVCLPIVLEVVEEIRWKRYISKISI